MFFMRERQREVSNRRKDTENKALPEDMRMVECGHRKSRNASGQLKLEAVRKDSSLEPPGGVGLGGNLEFGLGLQECEKIVFYCLKHQVCGDSLSTVAMWNEHRNLDLLNAFLNSKQRQGYQAEGCPTCPSS